MLIHLVSGLDIKLDKDRLGRGPRRKGIRLRRQRKFQANLGMLPGLDYELIRPEDRRALISIRGDKGKNYTPIKKKNNVQDPQEP
jgi:hypothetical protein